MTIRGPRERYQNYKTLDTPKEGIRTLLRGLKDV